MSGRPVLAEGRRLTEGEDGAADLVEVPVASVAFGEVLDQVALGVGVERALQICGDGLDEPVAVHHRALLSDRGRGEVALQPAPSGRPARCSGTRWFAGEI